MIRLIQQEADEKAQIIIEEAKQKMQKEKNKVYNFQRENLINEFKKKEEADQVQKRLEKSRKINQCRLEIQNFRNTLLERLKNELKEKTIQLTNNKEKYRVFMKELILQGLIRLLEPKVSIKCREKDVKLVESLFEEVQEEYKKFLQDNIGESKEVKLEMFPKNHYLSEEDMGGVILYCRNYKIVFDNSLKSRCSLCFKESIPDIRKKMFVSLQ